MEEQPLGNLKRPKLSLNDSSIIKEVESMTPDQAIEMLYSPKLKLLVYILINLIYNFNSIFVGAIPFLIDTPKFECL